MNRAVATSLWLGTALLATTGCESPAECTVPDEVAQVEVDWMRTLGCERDYEILWAERTDAIFARTRTINWLIDREDGDRVYFIDTVEWSLHYFFAAAYLDYAETTPVGSHDEFNLLNYRRSGRRFILGKLLLYVDQDLITMEMSAGDNADADMIAFAYGRVAASIYNAEELYYRPVSAHQESMLGELVGRIPIVRTEDVFRGQSYQPLNQTVGYGTLRFARVAELAAAPLAPTDIVVLDRVPNDISMVSGIITEEFQTPLSHINLLSKNRGTPNMGLRDAFSDPELRALEGQLVRLEVGPQEHELALAQPGEAQAFWDALRPSETLTPQYDLSATDVLDIAEFGHGDAIAVGAKAANIGELARIASGEPGLAIPLPERPFAIPFAFYDLHVRNTPGVTDAIDALIADAQAGALAPDELQMRLFAIRWAMYSAPMDPVQLNAVIDEVSARHGPMTRIRFRSSTNVEDLPEFSGAGLYTSASAELTEGALAIENAIKVVWASAWNYQAFVEREFYRVDHQKVRMAVLVHPAFEGELANGVAVTINEFTPLRPAYFINSQLGEVSVTNPTGQAIPEQILYYTWYEQPEYEVITRSSLLADGFSAGWPAGLAMFTDAELDELASYLEAIHNHFRGLYQGGQNFAMDVEFKLAPGRQLVIKQARPLARKAP